MINYDSIEEYLNGTLSKDQMEGFELKLAQDPEFKREFDFQNDIIESLKNTRKAELKARLNDVQIGSGIGSGSTGSIVKISSAIIITTGIGILGYLTLFDKTTTEDLSTTSRIEQKFADESKPEITQKENTEQLEDNKLKPESIDQSNNEKSSTGTEGKQTVVRDTQKESFAAPVPIKPEIIEDFPEDQETGVDVPDNTLPESTITFTKSNIEIEIQDDEQYDFHYRFVEDRLFLYGEFHGVYEIIEIREIIEILENEIHSIFLFYNNKFYALDKTRKIITSLQEIKDDELRSKLEQIKDR